MIRNLRQRLIILLMILLSIIFISILLVINVMNYNFNIRQQQYQFRETVYRIGIDAFCQNPPRDSRLEDLHYCTIQIPPDGEPEILFNNLADYKEDFLLEKSISAGSYPPRSGHFDSLVYAKRTWQGRVTIVFSDDGYAWENSKNLLAVSSVSGILGLIILFMLSVCLSRWLTAPAQHAFDSQKTFISDASHELKTPLTIISSNVDLLESEIGCSRQLQYIREEALRMNTLINEMLTLTRMDNPRQPGIHTSFSLTRALMSIALPFESVAYENGISFHLDMEEEMEISGDEEQLKRLLSILLDNAFQYVSPQGAIEVRLFGRYKKAFLSVANTGSPIPPEIREQIFERFFRADQSRTCANHYGLGLSIAHSIAEQHRGKIQVSYSRGMNVFLVILPM